MMGFFTSPRICIGPGSIEQLSSLGIRRALVPGGHFAGQLFGSHDEWVGERPLVFHTLRQARALTRGYRVDLFRETEEEGVSYSGQKHWHFFDVILEKPRG